MRSKLKDADRILLVGIWGSGKTTVGRYLGQKLGWDFIDSDELIDDFVIAVQSKNQERLRERSNLLRNLLLSCGPPVIVATNLRPLLTPENELEPEIAFAIESGDCIVIELRRDVAEISELFASDAIEREKRPSLTGQTRKAIMHDLLVQVDLLRPLYDRYRIGLVEQKGRSAEQVACEVLGLLAPRGIAPLDP